MEESRKLSGQWWYQSFCPLAATVDADRTPPLPIPAQIAGPWVRLIPIDFTTDSAGKITGTATRGTLTFNISGSVTGAIPAMEPLAPVDPKIPEGIELVIEIAGHPIVYNLRGYFLAKSDHIVGTVVSISNDLGGQPVGTSGPFVLYPASPQ